MSNSANAINTNAINDLSGALSKYLAEYLEREIPEMVQRTVEKNKNEQTINKEQPAKNSVAHKRSVTSKKKKPITRGEEVKKYIAKLSRNFNGNMSDREIIRLLKCAPVTFYKYKKELAAESIAVTMS